MRQISDLSHIALISNQQMVTAFSFHISKKVDEKRKIQKTKQSIQCIERLL